MLLGRELLRLFGVKGVRRRDDLHQDFFLAFLSHGLVDKRCIEDEEFYAKSGVIIAVIASSSSSSRNAC